LVLNGFACLGLAYSGCNITTAIFFLTLSLCLHGAVTAGPLSSIVDISPNFAGITLGVVSTITIMSGFVSPIIVGYVTFENQTIGAWQRIFEICAVMLTVCGTIYIWFNDTTLQPWNNLKKVYPKEIQPLYIDDEKQKLENVKKVQLTN
jgi:nitrate/nitrite transporter NarK